MATIRYKKRFNKWYVYELTQYWDKQLKKPRQRTKYLGVADEKDGIYTKPGKKQKFLISKLLFKKLIRKLKTYSMYCKS